MTNTKENKIVAEYYTPLYSHTALDCVSRHITVRKAIDRFQHL
jgi:hypothetical protein